MPRTAAPKASSAAKAPAKKPAARRKANGYDRPENIPLGEILTDLSKQQWKIGPSIGAGGFGDIYCACKANEAPKKHDDYQYVVKIVKSIAECRFQEFSNFYSSFRNHMAMVLSSLKCIFT